MTSKQLSVSSNEFASSKSEQPRDPVPCKTPRYSFGVVTRHLCGGGQGGGRPGKQGAGGVREMGEERAGGGISTMAGSGREIQKGSQRNEPNNVS